MITAKLNYKHTQKFINTTIRLEKQMMDDASATTLETAEEITRYIKDNWSSPPSSSGQPPAKRKGTLDEGITVEKQGRIKGRFAGKDATAHYIRFDTSKSGRGQYALAVNDGNRITYADERPYVEPALKVFTPIYIAKLKKRIRLVNGDWEIRT